MNKFDKTMVYFISISMFILAIITVFKLTEISITVNEIKSNIKESITASNQDFNTDNESDCVDSESCTENLDSE